MSEKSFSLTEILVALVLMGVIVLAVTSVDITSRRFFETVKDETWIQDEARIAMTHIAKNVELGLGDMTNASTPVGSPPLADDSRGFLILNDSGNLIDPTDPSDLGTQIQVKFDHNGDGRFTGSDPDRVLQYTYDSGNYQINFDPDVNDAVIAGSEEVLAEGIVESAIFSFDDSDPTLANRVEVTITVVREPGEVPSLDNPETTLTSSLILRAMSTN